MNEMAQREEELRVACDQNVIMQRKIMEKTRVIKKKDISSPGGVGGGKSRKQIQMLNEKIKDLENEIASRTGAPSSGSSPVEI